MGLQKGISLGIRKKHIRIGNKFEGVRTPSVGSGIFFASPEVMHRPRSDYPLHFNIGNIKQIRTEK